MKDEDKTIESLPVSFETGEEDGTLWGARSTMDYQECLTPSDDTSTISQLSPKDALKNEGFEEYEAGTGFFFSELVELNTIIYLAEQIVVFPFDLFVSRDNQTFFSVVMHSFYDSAILTITRLAADQSGDLFTLPRFKNRVRDLIKPQYSAAFDARLKEARFDSEAKALLTKAKNLRNHRISHTTQDFVAGNIQLLRPSISELKELRDALNSLLDALSFNVEYSMLPIPYNAAVLPRQKTDIEEILDSIAKNSIWLNMPEQYPERWRYRRTRLEGDKQRVFNHYRRKFNLPEI